MTDSLEHRDMKLAREICADLAERRGFNDDAALYRAGLADTYGEMRTALAGIEAGRKAERARVVEFANDFSFAADIDVWVRSTKKEMTALTCRELASAISSGQHMEGKE